MTGRIKRLKQILAAGLSFAVIGGLAGIPGLTSLAKDAENGTRSTAEVKDLDIELPDRDELFAEYAKQLLFSDRNDGINALGEVGEEKLTDPVLKTVYRELKAFIKEVAYGVITSTDEAEVTYSRTWSLDELGVSASSSKEDVEDALFEKILDELDPVVYYLLMDIPYEFYWFDKSIGYQLYMDYELEEECYAVTVPTFNFAIAEEYRKEATDWYLFDADKVSRVKEAVNRAAAIVEKYKDESDYGKLDAYRREICELVSYNFPAMENPSTPYGNPWQLIWVFDGDESTNVVCEGYSKAFQYLCDLSDFDSGTACYTITGMMGNGTTARNHMWNVVAIDGKRYLVDITNCDERMIGWPDRLFLAGVEPDATGGYTFVILGDDVRYINGPEQEELLGADILKLAETNYIQKPKLKITVPEVTVTYGDEISTEVLEGCSAMDGEENVEGRFFWAAHSYGDVGQKEIRAFFVPDDMTKYQSETFTLNVTVNPKPVTITAQKAEKFYGQTDPEFEYVIDSGTPLADGDSLAGVLGREKGENVKSGGYAITVGTLADENPNYDISLIGNILEVKPTSNYEASPGKGLSVIAGTGRFDELAFRGVNQEKISGHITYGYNNLTGMTYEEAVSELAKLKAGDTGIITYTFVPLSKNYIVKKDSIPFTVCEQQWEGVEVTGQGGQTAVTAVSAKRTAAPKTGDANTIAVYLLFMMFAAGMGYMVKYRKY